METTLAARVARGDRGALARALTVLEREGSRADELAQTLRSRGRGAFVVGVSGPPGAGKSTLISALVTEWRQRGERVAVLAVDPSSPLSRGALLGDRIRMDHHTSDPDVFIRSVASRGRLGGLSRALEAQLAAVDAAGWQIVILETVGTGQSEVDVGAVADLSVVLAAPGLGDEIQALKAGLLEIADVIVVNKADHPNAGVTHRQLSGMLKLRDPSRPPVTIMMTTATNHDGVPELVDHLEVGRAGRDTSGAADASADRRRSALARLVVARLHDQVAESAREVLPALLTDTEPDGSPGAALVVLAEHVCRTVRNEADRAVVLEPAGG